MEAKRLLSRSDDHNEEEEILQPSPAPRNSSLADGLQSWKTWCIVGLIAWALTASVTTAITASQLHNLRIKTRTSSDGTRVPEVIRSQVKSVVVQPSRDAWKNVTFVGKPSRESDLAWKQLQQVRGIWVSPSEARDLNIEGLYGPKNTTATLLGVMHNLHCIRVVRQILYPDYYYPDRTEAEHNALLVHAGHCLEAVRQSVMCNPDLTPRSVFWEDEERSNIAVNPSVRQTCVDWSSLVQWEQTRSYNLDDLWEANPAEAG